MEQLLIGRDTLQEIVDKVRDSLNVDDSMYITEVPGLVEILTGNLSKDICFTSLDDLVRVGLKGNGVVNLYVNNENKKTIELSDSFQYVELSGVADKCNIYQIDNADNITELDLREDAIDKLEFNSYNRINKLILMNNRISKLDLSKCKELKYLHFYDNPICDNDDYRDNLIECMNSLPDRNGKSIGSILLYPWYGLETLICKVDNEYKKYPQNTWTDHNGKEHHAYNNLRCNLFDPPSAQVTNYVDMVSRGPDVILTAHNYTNSEGVVTQVAGKKWLHIQFPIRSANLLKNRTATLSYDSIVSSGNNTACCYIGHLRPDGSGTYDVLGTFQNSDDAGSASIPFTYDDNMYILLYVNYDGEVADGDTVTFKNLSLVCDDATYKFVPGKLYGLVEDGAITSYYRGVSETFITPEDDITNHHQLRKMLEAGEGGTIKKNWVFGSAIQYHEDYKYCYHYFTNIGVQDVWETAEKGFGMCIGSCDQFRGKVYDWEDMNVLANENRAGCGRGPYITDGYHGDKILSHIMGRGNGYVYGICPNAQVYAIDNIGAGTWDSAADFLLNSPCTSLTYSYSMGQYNGMRYALGKFGERGIVTESAGNGGDGLPWSYEGPGKYCKSYGNYSSTDKDKSKYDLHTNTFFVNALSPLKAPTYFSNSSTDADYSYYGGFVPGDYLSHYGEQIAAYAPDKDKLSFIAGTSMSSPNCNATLTLMRVIYQKMYPEDELFGKDSDFMKYVERNWMDRLNGQMTFSVGLGMPSFNCEPNDTQVGSVQPVGCSYPSSVRVGEPFKASMATSNGCKMDMTYNYKYSHFAQMQDMLVPITKFTSSTVNIYTNTDIEGVGHSANANGGPSFRENYVKGSFELKCSEDILSTRVMSGLEDRIQASPISIMANDSTYECFNCGEYDGPMTVQFATVIDADIIPVEWCPDEAGSYIGNLELVLKRSNDSLSSMIVTVCAVEVSVDDNGVITKVLDIPYSYTYEEDGKTQTADNVFVYKGLSGTSGLLTTARADIHTGDRLVVTLVYDSDGEAQVYLNGTLVNSIVPGINRGIAANDILIPKYVLINDCADDVFIFNRKLTHEEILNNTITLL